MSSILKALKKIEGRKVDTSLPVWPFGSVGRESMDRHIHRSRQRQKILILLIILCGAALGGRLYFGFQPGADTAVSPDTPPSTALISPEPTVKQKPETEKTVTSQLPSPLAPESEPGAASSETAPSVTIAPSPVESTAGVTTEPAQETTTEETFGLPPAGSDTISLMALIWSEDPASRFAVINGTIAQKGDSIEGATVVRIEKDYVVMRTGDARWKLK